MKMNALIAISILTLLAIALPTHAVESGTWFDASGIDDAGFYPTHSYWYGIQDSTIYGECAGGNTCYEPNVPTWIEVLNVISRNMTAQSATGNLTWDSVFKIDDTNNRIGIGVTNPTVALDVAGETKISGISGDGTGRPVCIKSDGTLGTCNSLLGLTLTCTCI